MTSDSYAAIEEKISQACDAIYDGWYTNCIQVANAYDVFLCRLQNKWNGNASNSTKAPNNKALIEVQEGAIRKYIDRFNKINMCARSQIIVGVANYFFYLENCAVSYQWLKQFLKQNLEYHIQKDKPLAAEQKHSHSIYDMSNYFKKVKWVMREKRITKLDI